VVREIAEWALSRIPSNAGRGTLYAHEPEKVLLLQNVDAFSQVTLEQLSYLAAISQEITVPRVGGSMRKGTSRWSLT